MTLTTPLHFAYILSLRTCKVSSYSMDSSMLMLSESSSEYCNGQAIFYKCYGAFRTQWIEKPGMFKPTIVPMVYV